MPIYDYLCEKCGKKVELLTITKQKKERGGGDGEVIIENPQTKCRTCGEIMKRLPTQANFILKGNCWATDCYSSRRDGR